MNYFQVKNTPNFLLAAPILLLSLAGIAKYAHQDMKRFFTLGLLSKPHSSKKPSKKRSHSETFNSKAILMEMYLWLFLTFYCTFFMHIQILIRFFSCVPSLYWFCADIFLTDYKKDGRRIKSKLLVGYFVLYQMVGIVLYANFFPPA